MFSTCYWNFFCTSTLTLPDSLCISSLTYDNFGKPCSVLETLPLDNFTLKYFDSPLTLWGLLLFHYCFLFLFLFFFFFSLEARVSKLRNQWTSFRVPGNLYVYAKLCLYGHPCICLGERILNFYQTSKGSMTLQKISRTPAPDLLLGQFHYPPRLKWLPSKSQSSAWSSPNIKSFRSGRLWMFHPWIQQY